MSRFYLLPSRPQIGKQFGDYLSKLFPGIDWNPKDWPDLAEALGKAALSQPDSFVIFREDVPEVGDFDQTMTSQFGAEPGDEVFIIRSQEGVSEIPFQRRKIKPAISNPG